MSVVVSIISEQKLPVKHKDITVLMYWGHIVFSTFCSPFHNFICIQGMASFFQYSLCFVIFLFLQSIKGVLHVELAKVDIVPTLARSLVSVGFKRILNVSFTMFNFFHFSKFRLESPFHPSLRKQGQVQSCLLVPSSLIKRLYTMLYCK